ncbi:MAG TPA: LuxR C-terminal-related transcriptional regulator [Alphaproteobacteria bacterium]|nr:LuxR C-terminal-related transcriptional regulator [Alphaproteobacteria bacterium]
MNGKKDHGPIVIALDVGDADLADRLALLLAELPDVRLAAPGERGDVLVVSPERASPAEVDTGLTPRELEVLVLLAEGASNKTIARRLGISVHTAKFHVGSLLDKLDATGRTDAVAQAARLGVIHL